MKHWLLMGLLLLSAAARAAAGAQEEASAERAVYLAGKGIIIQPEEVHEDAYVSSIDYEYPQPQGDFSVSLYSGHKQISTAGQEEIFTIGIQGRTLTYEDLPPMNQCFLIDKSSSMYQEDKMSFVKESFDVFINKVRSKDYVSVVAFDETATALFPATLMNSDSIRRRYQGGVQAINPDGGTDLLAGLKLAFQQVLANYNRDYINRVILLTDGVGRSEGLIDLAEQYNEKGINISAIGLGVDFNHKLIRELTQKGGGSSRFISSREKMEEIFGMGFTRMVVPVARDITLDLYFEKNLDIVRVWAQEFEIEGQFDAFEREEGQQSRPGAVAVDDRGNLFVADAENNRILKLDQQGRLLTRWGGARRKTGDDPAEGKFDLPRSLAVGPNGTVFVVDGRNYRVQKFDNQGGFLTQWGALGRRDGSFREPHGIAVDKKGYVYVSDSAHHRVQKFDNQGVFVTRWGTQGSAPGEFKNPAALAVDRYRNVYVLDQGNQRVQIFESDGTFISQWKVAGAGLTIVGLAVDSEGIVYIADARSGRVLRYANNGSLLSNWGDRRENSPYRELAGLALDSQDNIYTTDRTKRIIQKCDRDGVFVLKQPVRFRLPAVNLGDYETIVLQTRIPRQASEGVAGLAELRVGYTDIDGRQVELAPKQLKVRFVPPENTADGISDAKVLRAGTMIHYAQALKEIGRTYYSGMIDKAFDIAGAAKKNLHNANTRLGGEAFQEELQVLEQYVQLLGQDLGFSQNRISQALSDREIIPPPRTRGFLDALNHFFEEMAWDLRNREPGNIAVTGFSLRDQREAGIIELLDKTAESILVALPEFTVLERSEIEALLDEQELASSDLMDTAQAVEVGKMLSADYLMTGSVIEMSGSCVIFGRVINIETGVIESVAQIIIPRDTEVNSLL